MAAKDQPQIGEVGGTQVLAGDSEAALWAGSISSPHPIERVWCLVIPPGHNPDPANPVTDIPQLDLVYDESTGRYALRCGRFTAPGTYRITYYARDVGGTVSPPRQGYVSQVGYEDRVILAAGGPTNSAEWEAVDYLSRLAYNTFTVRLFDADHVQTNIDTVLDVYRLETDGTLKLLDHVDEFGRDEGELTGLDFPTNGFYYVKISQYPAPDWQPGTYELSILIPTGAGANLIVVAINRVTEGALPTGSYAAVDSPSNKKYFNGAVNVTFTGLSVGNHTVTVPSPAFFFPREDPDLPNQVGSLTNSFAITLNVARQPVLGKFVSR